MSACCSSSIFSLSVIAYCLVIHFVCYRQSHTIFVISLSNNTPSPCSTFSLVGSLDSGTSVCYLDLSTHLAKCHTTVSGRAGTASEQVPPHTALALSLDSSTFPGCHSENLKRLFQFSSLWCPWFRLSFFIVYLFFLFLNLNLLVYFSIVLCKMGRVCKCSRACVVVRGCFL